MDLLLMSAELFDSNQGVSLGAASGHPWLQA